MSNTYLIPPDWIRDDGLSVIDNDPMMYVQSSDAGNEYWIRIGLLSPYD